MSPLTRKVNTNNDHSHLGLKYICAVRLLTFNVFIPTYAVLWDLNMLIIKPFVCYFQPLITLQVNSNVLGERINGIS